MEMDTVRVASSAFDGADSGDATAQRASARDTIVILRVIIVVSMDGTKRSGKRRARTTGDDDTMREVCATTKTSMTGVEE